MARAEADAGARIAATCAACHRLDGGGANPSIVDWEAKRLAGRLQAYKSDAMAKHDMMHVVSLSLSDDEIAAVASYLAARGRDAAKR